jgi:sugar/nucleoside kinase (ribokinase family)
MLQREGSWPCKTTACSSLNPYHPTPPHHTPPHPPAQVIAVAHQHGTLVAMSAGDAGVVHRHHAAIWGAIELGIDLLFANLDEAEALLQYQPAAMTPQQQHTAVGRGWAEGGAPSISAAAAAAPGASQQQLAGEGIGWAAEEAALRLGPYVSMASITAGSGGSVITALGQLHVVPPHWMETRPCDTCGAGDAYAAGLLYAFMRHYDVNAMGRTAARVASAVIQRHGAALTREDAEALAATLPQAADRSAVLAVLE